VEGRATCVPAGDELANTGPFVQGGNARLRAADTRDDILVKLSRALAKSPYEAGIGFVPGEFAGPGPLRSSPAGTRVARSFADKPQLRSTEKRRVAPGCGKTSNPCVSSLFTAAGEMGAVR
jgi:hypothetical protein